MSVSFIRYSTRFRWGAWGIVAALVAALASSAVGGRATVVRPDILGCEHGCVVAAGGWPFAYIIDHPGLSPVGSVSLINGLLGIDQIRTGPLLATTACWLIGFAGLAWGMCSRSGRRPAG